MLTPLLVVSMIIAIDVVPPEFSSGNDELKMYLIESGENNPTLQAYYDDWRAALEEIPQVTSLDDPKLSMGVFLQSELNDFKVMVSQKFPWFGTLKARGEKSALEAEAALEKFYNERNRIFSEVKKAYYEYAYLGESLEVVDSQLDVLKYIEDIIASKFEVGMANEDELLRISIERTRVNDRRDQILELTPVIIARLNEAIGVDVRTERPVPQPTTLPNPLPEDNLVHSLIRESNPDLKRLELLIQSKEKQIELAKKKGFPDFTVGLEYMSVGTPETKRPDRPYPATLGAINRTVNTLNGNVPFNGTNALLDMYSLGTSNEPMSYPDDMDDNVALTLSINVPLWRKKVKAGVSGARLRKSATENYKYAKALQLDKASKMTIFQVNDAERRFYLFERSLLPQAQRSYDSLQEQYAVADYGTSFIDVLDSIQTLLSIKLEQVKAKRDWLVASSELEYLIGNPWEENGLEVNEKKD